MSSGLVCALGSAQGSPGSVQPWVPSLGWILSYGLIFPAYPIAVDVQDDRDSWLLSLPGAPLPCPALWEKSPPCCHARLLKCHGNSLSVRGEHPGTRGCPCSTTRAQIAAFPLREERKPSRSPAAGTAQPVLIQGCHLPSAPAAPATAPPPRPENSSRRFKFSPRAFPETLTGTQEQAEV